ncbi:MAG: PAS domain-containing protein, partial [Gammaproteobacteria bacterium]
AICGILTLHRWSNESHRIVGLLSSIEAQANRLNALEWEALARKDLIAELRRSQQFARHHLDRTFAEINKLVDNNSLLELRITYREYLRAIDAQFRLLDARLFTEAHRVDEEQVGPNYDALIDAIAQAQIRYGAASRWTILLVDIGTSLVLIAAAISIGFLFSRFEQIQRVKQVLLAEQNALRASEERFRALVHNTSDIIAILAPLPPTIQFVSDSIRRILGHRPSELIGSDFGKLVHPGDTSALQRFLANCAYSAGSTYMVELRIQRANGDWCVVEMFGDNRVKHPAIRGIVINFHDVTARKQVEEFLEQRQIELELPDRKLH